MTRTLALETTRKLEIRESGKEVLAIVPARGGSKGLPRKNILPLAGKPLIAYSIEAAMRSGIVDRVIVSTEDEEIASVAKEFGAEVPFLRPKHLADDEAEIWGAVSYTLNRLRQDGYIPRCHVVLYPTSPFRKPSLVRSLVGKILEGYAKVCTAKLIRTPKFGYFYRDEDGAPGSVAEVAENVERKEYIRFTGAFYGLNGRFDSSGKYVHIQRDPIELIDIDDREDYMTARLIAEQNLYDFGK